MRHALLRAGNAFTADECKSSCCADASCTVWQFAQYPMGHQAQCMWGDSTAYGDSGGIQFQGEQGRSDRPGHPCTGGGSSGDPFVCTDQNGDVWDLTELGRAGTQTVSGPSDPPYDFVYAFSLDTNIDPMPRVCWTFSIFETNAVRYDDRHVPSQTCDQMGPNLHTSSDYQFSVHDGVLTFEYDHGLMGLNISLECSPGSGTGVPSAATGPYPVRHNASAFRVVWKTDVVCKADPSVAYRCVDNKCQRSAPGLPGLDNTTCAATCGPLTGCLPVLASLCHEEQGKGPGECMFCAGSHSRELLEAGCTSADFKSFCGARVEDY